MPSRSVILGLHEYEGGLGYIKRRTAGLRTRLKIYADAKLYHDVHACFKNYIKTNTHMQMHRHKGLCVVGYRYFRIQGFEFKKLKFRFDCTKLKGP